MRRILLALFFSALVLSLFGVASRIREVKAYTDVFIRADGSVDPSWVPISSDDNITYVLTGNLEYMGISVERSNIIIDGRNYTILGDVFRSGIYVYNISNVTTENVNVEGCWSGIYIKSSPNCTLLNNSVTGCSRGIRIASAQNTVLRGNLMFGSTYDFCLEPSGLGDLAHDIDTSNLVSGKPIYYWSNQNNASVPTDAGFVALINCSQIVAENLTLLNNRFGMFIVDSPNCTIVNVDIEANPTGEGSGIYLLGSDDVAITHSFIRHTIGIESVLSNRTVISDNVLRNYIHLLHVQESIIEKNIINDDAPLGAGAVDLKDCQNITVRDNTFGNVPNYGIYLWATTRYTTIERNNMSYGGGVGDYGTQNTMRENFFSYNGAYGISLMGSQSIAINNTVIGDYAGIDSADNNIIKNNVIMGGQHGFILSDNNLVENNFVMENQVGVAVLISGSNNVIVHNSFLRNQEQVKLWTPEYNNTWDYGYPYGGNYWGNYSGTDLNEDGIGDQAYTISAGNVDRYPLMGFFYSFNTSYDLSVDFISNSSISNLTFALTGASQATLSFNATQETGTSGFLRISIPRFLINSSYTVKSNGQAITYPAVKELPFSNETYLYLYINYSNNENSIEITGLTMIPEFPSNIIASVLVATISLIVALKRKLRMTRITR